MIEKVIPDKISFTLPTVFGEELTFLEFCGRVRAKLNECIDVVNDKTATIDQFTARIDENAANINTVSGKVDKNTTDIQKNATNIQKNATAISANTANIQKNTTAISANQSSITALSGKVDKNTTDIQQNTDGIARHGANIDILLRKVAENILTLNQHEASLDKLSKNFELVEQFTLTEDVTQIYRNQKPNGEAYNFNDVIMTLNIPIIEEGSSETYGGTFLYIVNSETDIADYRVVAQGGVFKKGQVSNISVRAKIDGGIVFGDYGASSGNLSNKQSAFTSYSNIGMISAESITSILFTFFGQPIFSGTTIKIYAR